MGLYAHHVGGEHIGAGNERRETVRALHSLHLWTDRCTDRDVIQHLAPHPLGDFGRAFDEAPDLQIDPPAELLDAEARLETFLDDAFQESADRPPERTLGGM